MLLLDLEDSVLQLICKSGKTCGVIKPDNRLGTAMPLINVKIIENVFTAEQKRDIVERLTEAMVSVEGENMRSVTWGRCRGGLQRRRGDRREGPHHRRCQGACTGSLRLRNAPRNMTERIGKRAKVQNKACTGAIVVDGNSAGLQSPVAAVQKGQRAPGERECSKRITPPPDNGEFTSWFWRSAISVGRGAEGCVNFSLSLRGQRTPSRLGCRCTMWL